MILASVVAVDAYYDVAYVDGDVSYVDGDIVPGAHADYAHCCKVCDADDAYDRPKIENFTKAWPNTWPAKLA